MRAVDRWARLPCVSIALLCAAGCLGQQATSETSGDADASAVQSIEGIGQDIERAMDAVLGPVNQVDALLEAMRTAPQRLNLDTETLTSALVAAMQGKPLVRADGSALGEAAQSEVQQLSEQIAAIIVQLESTPTSVKLLLDKITSGVARIPALAAEGQAAARVALSNPFADDAEKLKAQADVDALAELPSRVLAKLQDAQARLMALPARAVQAMGDLSSLVPTGELDLVMLAKAASPAPRPGGVQFQIAGAAAVAGRTSDRHAASRSAGAPALASPSRPVAAATALEIVGPRLDRATDTLIERLANVEAFQADLRAAAKRFNVPRTWLASALAGTSLGSPLVQPDGLAPPPEVQAELARLSDLMLWLLAELAATPAQVEELANAAEQTDVLLPRLMADVDTTAQVWLDSFRPTDAAAQQAQLDRVVRIRANASQAQREVLAAVERARAEGSTLGRRAAAASTALLRALPVTAVDLRALATSRVSVGPLLAPLPPIGPPPARAATPTAAKAVEANPYALASSAESQRADVREALRSANAGIAACAQGLSGTATASLRVNGASGRITAVEITFDAEFDRQLATTVTVTVAQLQDDYANCMTDVLFDVQLPRFAAAELSVVYPFVLVTSR